jgi:hypothetical protein
VDHDTVYLGTLSASKYTSVDSRPVTPDLSCDTDLAPTTNQPPMSPPPPRMQPSRGVSGSHSSCQAANAQAGQLQPPEWRHIPTLAYIDHQCQVSRLTVFWPSPTPYSIRPPGYHAAYPNLSENPLSCVSESQLQSLLVRRQPILPQPQLSRQPRVFSVREPLLTGFPWPVLALRGLCSRTANIWHTNQDLHLETSLDSQSFNTTGH